MTDAAPAHAQATSPEDDTPMGFFEHLGELRTRLLRSLLGIFPGAVVAWIYRDHLLGFMVAPFTRAWKELNVDGAPKLVFLNPIDPFVVYIKMAMVAGFVVALPWVFWQFWAFISPGLYRREKRLAIPFVIVSTLFFAGGISFGFWVILPIAFRYFLQFATELPSGLSLEATIAMGEILSLEIRLLIAFGAVFELPVVIGFLAGAGIVNWKQLLAFSRWWSLIAAVLSALLTPPDPASMLMMFGPLMGLYYLSVGIAYVVGPKKK